MDDKKSPRRRRSRQESAVLVGHRVLPPLTQTPRATSSIDTHSATSNPSHPGVAASSSISKPSPPVNTAESSLSPPVKKPRKQKIVTEGSRETLVQSEDSSSRTSENVPNKKRKKKVRVFDNLGLESELNDMKDDIVTKEQSGRAESGQVGAIKEQVDLTPTVLTKATIRSEPTGKLFIERRNDFKVRDKTKVDQRRMDEAARRAALVAQSSTMTGPDSSVSLALWTHYGLSKVYAYMRGILAGVCLWQVISTYTLINQGSSVFLSGYYSLANPLQSLYFLLFAVSTVSVLDMFDLARPTRTFVLQSVSFKIGTIAVLFYFTGLVFSVSTAFMDERIAFFRYRPSLWNSTETTTTILYQWSILNLIRGIMAMIGFLIICLSRPINRLKESLHLSDDIILSMEGQAHNQQLNSQPHWEAVASSGDTFKNESPTSADVSGTQRKTELNATSLA